MAKHYHTCGAMIWIHSRWNGLEHIPVFSNVDCNEIDHCPGCGEWLTMEVLSEHPPERDDSDLAPRLLEALEKVVAQFEGIADDKWPTQGMKVAIEGAIVAIDEHADFMDAINDISQHVEGVDALRDGDDWTTAAINNLTRAVLVLAKIQLHQAHVGITPYYE